MAIAHRSLRPACRVGFTLVELLIGLAVVAALVSLLMPAVQVAREAARRSRCSGNLKQLALGLLAYEQTNSRFPQAATVSDTDVCDGCFDPWGEARRMGVGPGDDKHGTSWVLEVLPHLEAAVLLDRWDRQTNVLGNAAIAQTDIPHLYCPTRRSGIRVEVDDHLNLVNPDWRGGGTDYGGSMGRVQGFINSAADVITGRHRFASRSSIIAGNGLKEGIFRPDLRVAAAAVLDGMSNTLLVGEMQRLRPPQSGTASDKHKRTSQDGWVVGGVATLFTTATDPSTKGNPGGLNNLFFESPGSEHLGGAFFAMADGSTRFISEFVDAKDNNSVFAVLGSMRDGFVLHLTSLDP